MTPALHYEPFHQRGICDLESFAVWESDTSILYSLLSHDERIATYIQCPETSLITHCSRSTRRISAPFFICLGECGLGQKTIPVMLCRVVTAPWILFHHSVVTGIEIHWFTEFNKTAFLVPLSLATLSDDRRNHAICNIRLQCSPQNLQADAAECSTSIVVCSDLSALVYSMRALVFSRRAFVCSCSNSSNDIVLYSNLVTRIASVSPFSVHSKM